MAYILTSYYSQVNNLVDQLNVLRLMKREVRVQIVQNWNPGLLAVKLNFAVQVATVKKTCIFIG